MEIENDAPPNSAIEELVAGLNAAMGAGHLRVHRHRRDRDRRDQGRPDLQAGASCRRSARYKIITTAIDPRFIDTLNRPSLAQTFERNATGARLTVVVNHLKSKGSDCNAVGDPDTGDGPGNCNVTRTNAAKALVDWLATDPTGSGDPDFLFIGDLNSYTFEDPIDWITTHGYTNLVREFGGLDPVLVRVQRRVRLPRPRAGQRLARGAGDRHRRLAHQPRRADRARLQRRVQDAPTRSPRSTTRVRTARRITTRSSSA